MDGIVRNKTKKIDCGKRSPEKREYDEEKIVETIKLDNRIFNLI